jgi:hypothetical protein
MKKIITIFLLVQLGCTNYDPIIGDWKRTGDLYEGSVIKIKSFGDDFQGIIISPNQKMKDYTFQKGEVYLKNLMRVEENKYKAEGLIKGYKDNVQTYYYTDILLELENKNLLIMKTYTSDKNIVTGSEYHWIRLE